MKDRLSKEDVEKLKKLNVKKEASVKGGKVIKK